MTWRALLDASPVAHVALALMRDATGRDKPLEPLLPARPSGLPPERGLAFWSLTAGVGVSTVAALVAHRASSTGRAPVLVDLDRRAPTQALRAECAGASVTDALLRPGGEAGVLSTWARVPFLPGSPELHRSFDGPRLAELIVRLHRDRPVILDLGPGVEALDGDVLAAVDRLCVVVGTTVAQLQAAFCSIAVLEGIGTRVGVVVVGAEGADATRVAARLPWPLLAAIPADPFLARDDFAARAPTLRAIDALIRSFA